MRPTQRLGVVLALDLALVGGLLGAGVVAHSVAVLAEAVDDLADAAGAGVAIAALRREARGPTGAGRSAALAGLVNAGWLLALCLGVLGTAVGRLVAGVGRVEGLPVVVSSGVAALAMAAGALVLAGGDGSQPGGGNARDLASAAVLLDTAADAAAAAAVAGSGAVILAARGLYWLDPALAAAVSVVVAWQAVQLLRRASAALARADSHAPPDAG